MFRIEGVSTGTTELRMLSAVLVAFVVLSASVAVGGATVTTRQDATQQATPIDSCTTIDEPGTYRLVESIENSTADVCILIQASDVHFDGGGHTVDGNVTRRALLERLAGPPPSEGVGIGVNIDGSSPVSNVTVTNVVASDWFFGVLVRGASGATVRDVTGTASGIGILVDATTGARVERSNASNNVISGVSVSGSLDRRGNNTVENVTTAGNGRYGVLLVDSPSSTVRDITATGNAFVGLEVVNSSHATVRNVTVTENAFRGFGVDAFPGHVTRNVTVADSNFSRNGYIGIAVFATTNSTFANNSVAGTRGVLSPERSPPVPSAGIAVDFGSGDNRFVDTDARDQADWAYVAVNSSTNTVEDLRTDAAMVSFEGRNVALGPTATASPGATDDTNTTRIGGIVATNVSADAFVDLQITWSPVTAADRPANETASGDESR